MQLIDTAFSDALTERLVSWTYQRPVTFGRCRYGFDRIFTVSEGCTCHKREDLRVFAPICIECTGRACGLLGAVQLDPRPLHQGWRTLNRWIFLPVSRVSPELGWQPRSFDWFPFFVVFQS